MTSHIHMIIGSEKEKLENIMRDMKKFTSAKLKRAIAGNSAVSRREWMFRLMEEAELPIGRIKISAMATE